MTRNEIMADYFKQGYTLQEIGDIYGISRERVRQILKKQGVKWFQGGAHKTKQLKEAAMLAEKEERIQKRLGISYKEYRELLKRYPENSPFKRYREQKKTMRWLGIKWDLTFKQWWDIWKKSKKWNRRGLGKFVMARIDKSGGFTIDNVHIVHHAKNSSDTRRQCGL